MASARPSSFTLTKPGPYQMYSMRELLRLRPPRWMVKGVLPQGGLVGLYGEPGSYKSFAAIDIAMSVATGKPWQGHEVEKGHVIYVGAEGGVGLAKRGWAWMIEHKVTNPDDVDIAWLTESIAIANDSEDYEAFFNRIDNELQRKPVLIVIDTLARCFDGDENQQEDMGRFIGGVDRLRREYDATVIVVHHTRLGADRERGSTAFRGAADTMVAVKRLRDGEVELSCNKQKDSEEFLTRQFEMRKVVLPPHIVTGEDMETSIVMVEAALERDEQILAWIQAEMDNDGITFGQLKDLATQGGSPMSPAALKRRLVSLVKSSKIIRENAIYKLVEAH